MPSILPRERSDKKQLLVINPNTSKEMTELIYKSLKERGMAVLPYASHISETVNTANVLAFKVERVSNAPQTAESTTLRCIQRGKDQLV